ncbi:MAG: SDR family oxidoreductase, partial [Kordiimonadaceae bacterium]|nr:SDR family oxidoreductase [Kordiimonadaceae bacterium]
GANVAVHYRSDKEGADALVDKLVKNGSKAISFYAELTDADSVAALMQGVTAHFGSLDVAINNAGIFPNATVKDMTLNEWRAMMAVNTDTVFLCTQQAAAQMKNGGAIINIASIAGMNPGPAHAHYNSSKAAVIMFTQSAAQEYAKSGIRVNAVSPGLINRDGIRDAWPEGVERWESQAPLKRMGEASDIADACLFLASPAARHITGINLPVEGGVMASPIY